MRAMPSPTSTTVPTSLTWSRCSKPAISRFNTLVISATLMAMNSSPNQCDTETQRAQRTAQSSLCNLSSVSVPISVSSVSLCRVLFRGNHLLSQRRELRADGRVDQFVLHADDQAADDVFVDVLVHHR